MAALDIALRVALLSYFYRVAGYSLKDHPCCGSQDENITLATVLDPFEIYGHDPADKLDHLLHYQTEMYKIKDENDQLVINEHAHVATDHLERFIALHMKELKILMIALDDALDNMITMYDNHNAIKNDRVQNYKTAGVPLEFYLSQEFYCGRNVYIFVSELYSDIYNMGRNVAPYCMDRAFYFLGFVHHVETDKYYLDDDVDVAFPMDDYHQGLECHLGICIFRFPQIKNNQHTRDLITLPKSITKCGLVTYKLPPLAEAKCIVASGSFIFEFNIQGIKYRHHDFQLILPNGQRYYTKENNAPIICHESFCEWKYLNYYGGPFAIPGVPANDGPPIPPWITPTTPQPNITTTSTDYENITVYKLEGCWYMFPPNYGSIAGVSYLDALSTHDSRYTCQPNGKGVFWYPRSQNAMSSPPEEYFTSQGRK